MYDNDIACKIDAERLAQLIIDRSDKIRGWSMRNIVKMVRDEMGGRAAYHAERFIIAGGHHANR